MYTPCLHTNNSYWKRYHSKPYDVHKCKEAMQNFTCDRSPSLIVTTPLIPCTDYQFSSLLL